MELHYSLKETQKRKKLSLGRLLVAAQVSLTLLVASGAFVRSLQNLHSFDLGFKSSNVLMFEIDPRQTGYQPPQINSFYNRLLERIEGLPGVQSAALSRVTYSRGVWGNALFIPGDRAGHIVRANFITPHYFETLGIPLGAGRAFGPQDSLAAPKTAIVNEVLARKFFPGASALGRRFRSRTRTPKRRLSELYATSPTIASARIRRR